MFLGGLLAFLIPHQLKPDNSVTMWRINDDDDDDDELTRNRECGCAFNCTLPVMRSLAWSGFVFMRAAGWRAWNTSPSHAHVRVKKIAVFAAIAYWRREDRAVFYLL